jgi:hypothetical protein
LTFHSQYYHIEIPKTCNIVYVVYEKLLEMMSACDFLLLNSEMWNLSEKDLQYEIV